MRNIPQAAPVTSSAGEFKPQDRPTHSISVTPTNKCTAREKSGHLVDARVFCHDVLIKSKAKQRGPLDLCGKPDRGERMLRAKYRSLLIRMLVFYLQNLPPNTYHVRAGSKRSGKSAMASSFESTSHGSSGVQSTSAANTLCPASDRDPLEMACSADLRPNNVDGRR